MQVSEAVFEYLKSEIVPFIAGDSEMTAAILSGMLHASRKRIAEKISQNEILRISGFLDGNGCADPEMVKEFANGMFEGREKVRMSLAELMKMVTGVESSSPLLQKKIIFTAADAEKFIALLNQ